MKIEKNKKDVIRWIYNVEKNWNFWFIDVEWVDKGYFVYGKNSDTALDGDEVEAIVKIFKWRKEAVIKKVIKRADRVFVWTLQMSKTFWFVVLDNKAINKDVFVPYKDLHWAKNNDRVAVKVTSWSKKSPEWYITSILWKSWDKWMEVKSLIYEAWLKLNFPKSVKKEASNLKIWSSKNRTDLTKTFTVTIDWSDARDLDDAISVFYDWKNYKLIVSIADVSEYVKEGSNLDKEAQKRWNSTYLPDRVIPMLSEELSNHICSLNKESKKNTLSCEMIIDNRWIVVESKVYESVIESNFRLTYLDTQNIYEKKLKVWDKLEFWDIITKELIDMIDNSYKLKNIISARKQKAWVLDFEFPETKIILDENSKPVDIKKYPIYESNKLIEEFMVIANETIWQKFQNIPFIYRIHEIPDEDSIESLRKTLAIFWITLPYKDITPNLLREVLVQIKWHKKEKLLSMMILRSLKKAIYSHENLGHFGLAIDFYTHFTSPIRRYPDLVAHRIIKEFISKKLDKKRKEHYENILPQISRHTSETSRKSEKLEYSVKDYYICRYYEDKIWEEYDWIITWMIASGFFVSLENTSEWLVSFDSVLKKSKSSRCDFIESELKAFVWDLELQVGDSVRIKILSVDFDIRKLNFDLVEKYI